MRVSRLRLAERGVVIWICIATSRMIVFPPKGSALDKACAFGVVVAVLMAAGMLMGYVDTGVLLQLIAVFK